MQVSLIPSVGRAAAKPLFVAGLVFLVLQGNWLPAMLAACVGVLAGTIAPGAWMGSGPFLAVAVMSPAWSSGPLLSSLGAASWWTFGIVAVASSGWSGQAMGRQVLRWTLVVLLWTACLWTLAMGVRWMLAWPLAFGWSAPVFPVRFRPFGFHGATQLGALIAMCFVGVDGSLARLRSKSGRFLSIASRCVVVLALVWVDSRAAWLALFAVGLIQGKGNTRGLLVAGIAGSGFSVLLEWLPVLDVSSRGSRLGALEHLLPLSAFLAREIGCRLERLPRGKSALFMGIVGLPVAVPLVVQGMGMMRNALQTVATGRTVFWDAAWRAVAESPFVGFGAWSYTRAYLDAYGLTSSFVPMHAHSLPLQILVDFGLLGCLGGGLAIGAIWWWSRAGLGRRPAIASLLALWVHSATDVPGSEVLWLGGLVLGMVSTSERAGWPRTSRWWGVVLTSVSIWVGVRALLPTDEETRLLRGSLAWQAGHPGEAEGIWTSGLPQAEEARRASLLSRFARGSTGGDWMSDADQAAQKAPWHPQFALARIHALWQAGMVARGDSLLKKQANIWPTVQIHWISYLRNGSLGDTLRARRSLIEAMKLDPSVAGLGVMPQSAWVIDSMLHTNAAFRWSETSLADFRQGDSLRASRACRIASLALTAEAIGPPLRCVQALGNGPGNAREGNQPIRHAPDLHELYAYGAKVPPALSALCWERVRHSSFVEFVEF